MSKGKILQSNLLEVGAKFVVTDKFKDNTYPPGTMGFICHIKGIDDNYQNVAKVNAVIIRRGKGGKPRLEFSNLLIPIFMVENENFDKILPCGTRKYFVSVIREAESISDVRLTDPLDFLGWATSMAHRIKKMSDSCKHKKWPEDKANPVRRILNLTNHFNEDPEKFLEEYSYDGFRTEFVDTLRRMGSAMARIHLMLDLTKVDCEINAAEFLEFTNKGEFIPKDAENKTNEYKFTDDDKLLERSVDYYHEIKEEIQKLYNEKRNSKKSKSKS
jgi:hypothetical protein